MLSRDVLTDPLTDYELAPAGGAELLDEVAEAIRRYCILPSPQALNAVVLWVACTHMTPAFEYAPRLVARSPEKRSGKSRLLEVVDALAYEPLRAVNATVSYIFRSLDGDRPPTLLLDEADTIFGSKKVAENNEDLRGLLNAGFQRGLTFGRTVGPQHTPTEFQTFAMAALAGIGAMPDTIEDRAVVVVMRRRKASETVAPYRTRRDRPHLVELADQLADWAASVIDSATGYEPGSMGVEDRAADVWEPLITVADMAGGRWPALAREAAAFMVSAAEAESEDSSLNIKLLADIKSVFDIEGAEFLPSAKVCELLRGIEESPWSQFDLNPSRLSHRLREYGITTGRNTTGTARGYRRIDLLDCWERYLPSGNPSEPVKTRPHAPDQQQPSDASLTSDGLNPSDDFYPSDDNRSSEGVLTGSDAFGRATHGERVCEGCGGAIYRDDATVCAACSSTGPAGWS